MAELNDATVETLLGAVRGRLWRAEFAGAARRACWVSAGLVLAAAALHLLAGALSLVGLLATLALPWLVLLARAAWRRPDRAACALWADRHLGGASAYTTWLETAAAPDAGRAAAVRRLGRWAAAQAPVSLQALAARRDPPRLARPLAALAVCTALAALVLALPEPAPAPRAPAADAAGPAPVAGSAPLLAPGAEDAGRIGAVAQALRAAPAREEREARERGGGSAAGPPGDATATASAGGAAPTGAATAPRGDAVAAAGDAPAGAAGGTAGRGGGREAGDARDERADVGVSRAAAAPQTMPRSATPAGAGGGDRRADDGIAAAYDEEGGRRGGGSSVALAAPAATAPPAAADAMPPTPSEASYVRAWMKASARRP